VPPERRTCRGCARCANPRSPWREGCIARAVARPDAAAFAKVEDDSGWTVCGHADVEQSGGDATPGHAAQLRSQDNTMESVSPLRRPSCFDLDFMLVDDLAKTKLQWEWLKAKELKAEHLASDT
jgi:hypothetical protein